MQTQKSSRRNWYVDYFHGRQLQTICTAGLLISDLSFLLLTGGTLLAHQNLAIIPALLHAAILSLLTAAIPLKTIATAVTLAVPAGEGEGEGEAGITVDPSTREADTARSLHVLGYTSDDELLLAESQGAFTVDEWEGVLKAGQEVCCRAVQQGLEDTPMTGGGGGSSSSGSGLESASIRSFIRSVMETKIAGDLSWK